MDTPECLQMYLIAGKE